MKWFLVYILLIFTLIIVYFFRSGLPSTIVSVILPTPAIIRPVPTVFPAHKLIYISDVPFAAQAPFGNWQDPQEQNGCEEAAAVIAVYWAKNQILTPRIMLNEIQKISDFEIKEFGTSVDTSAGDAADRIFKGYFKYNQIRVAKLTAVSQIVNYLDAGSLVVTPMNGQLLGNPFYTPPGPQRHMIVIRGYDPQTDEFITNDAGTRHGENFRYSSSKFFFAIRDYPTGDHLPITDESSKSAIIVSR